MKLFRRKSKKEKENPVVDFFLHASDRRKQKVLDEVAENVNEEQRKILDEYRAANEQA